MLSCELYVATADRLRKRKITQRKINLVSSLEQIIYNNNERGKGSNSVGQNRNCLINQQEEQSLNMVYQISHEKHNLTFL